MDMNRGVRRPQGLKKKVHGPHDYVLPHIFERQQASVPNLFFSPLSLYVL